MAEGGSETQDILRFVGFEAVVSRVNQALLSMALCNTHIPHPLLGLIQFHSLSLVAEVLGTVGMSAATCWLSLNGYTKVPLSWLKQA